MKQKTSFFYKFVMVVLLVYPILGIYGKTNGWSFGEMLVIPISTLFFVYYVSVNKSFTGNKNPLPEGFLSYILYWGAITLFSSFVLPLSVIQSYLAFFLFFATFRQEPFLKMYKTFAIICIVFFVFQEFSYLTTGYRISGILRFLPLHYDLSVAEFIDRQSTDVRSCSFFSEPAHFAQFLLPLLAIELFQDNSKKHYLYAIIIGVVLLFLQSGNGLFGMAVILMMYVPYLLGQNNRYKFLTIGLFAFVIVFAGFQFFNSEMGGYVMERQAELQLDSDSGNRSGFMRIWRGFFVYDDYSILEKIVGCPNDNAQLLHVRNSGMLLGLNAELYFNAFQKILLNTGLVGLGIMVFIIIRLWRGNTACGKAILASFVVLSLIAAIYMSHTMILYLVLAYSMKRENSVMVQMPARNKIIHYAK